jgi:TolB-like protein/class 3 adenylate cyclase
MAEERVQRRLAAILAADVAGYSRLVREDEEGTLGAVRSDIAEAFEPNVAAHNGRIFKTMGDGLLAEFASVVDAVRCAVAVQRAMADRNVTRPDNRKIDFRIGINLGDVVAEGDDLHGDGVNVSARLEGLADPGGIFISGTAFDQIQKNVDVGYEFLGEREVKNIADPVRVYRVLTGPEDAGKLIGVSRKSSGSWKWPAIAAGVVVVVAVVGAVAWLRPWQPAVEPASVERMAFPLPEKPSIAVLPFTNMSGDKEQEYFADGITEDIITDLSKVSGLVVIARNSTFTYKGKAVKVKKVAEDLGVRYVLEGSVRRAGGRVRITAQLIDTVKGNHLWADRYDRELKDVFAVQSDVTKRVVKAMAVTLKASEQERLFRPHTTNIDAYDLFLKARKAILPPTKESLERARQLYGRIIELDPEFAGGYAGLSFIHSVRVRVGLSIAPKSDIERALELAIKATHIDEQFGWSFIALGSAQIMARNPDAAVAATRRALEIQPNDSDAHCYMGFYLTFSGRASPGIENILRSMRLDPRLTIRQVFFLGMAYFMNGDHSKAISILEKMYVVKPIATRASILPMAFLAASYATAAQAEKAARTGRQILKIDPEFKVSNWRFIHLFKSREDQNRILNALRKAGLPE